MASLNQPMFHFYNFDRNWQEYSLLVFVDLAVIVESDWVLVFALFFLEQGHVALEVAGLTEELDFREVVVTQSFEVSFDCEVEEQDVGVAFFWY